MKFGWAALPLIVLTVGCTSANRVEVQLVSDMTPGREIDAATVTLEARSVTVALLAGRSLGRPVRLASFSDVTPGHHDLFVTLQRGADVVLSRHVARDVEGTTIVTVLMTRDCRGVVCPTDASPTADACLGGRCVSPDCDEERPDLCAQPSCTSDASCAASTVACAAATCSTSGACFVRADDSRCAPGELCDTAIGCVRPWTSTLDAASLPLDAAMDAAMDVDAGSADAGAADAATSCGPFSGAACVASSVAIGADLPSGATLADRWSIAQRGCELGIVYGYSSGTSDIQRVFERRSLADGHLLSRAALTEPDHLVEDAFVVEAGGDGWAVLYRAYVSSYELRLQLFASDGTLDGPSIQIDPALTAQLSAAPVTLHWDGTRWIVAAGRKPSDVVGNEVVVWAIDGATHALGEVATYALPSDDVRAFAWNGDELAVAVYDPTTTVGLLTLGPPAYTETRPVHRLPVRRSFVWANLRLARWSGRWILTYVDRNLVTSSLDLDGQELDDAFGLIGSPTTLLSNVEDTTTRTDAMRPSLVSDGVRWAAGYPIRTIPNDRAALFASTWPAGPALDLSALGVASSSACCIDSQVTVGARDAVLRAQPEGARLLLLCGP